MELHETPGHLIRRLHQRSSQVFAARLRAAGHDMTSVQFAALSAIRAAPAIDQAGVAAAIAYDRATIGGVIDRLVAKGLVARTVSPRDRRARELRLTAEGEATFATLGPLVEDLQDDILGRLTGPERETFVQLARKAISGDEAPEDADAGR